VPESASRIAGIDNIYVCIVEFKNEKIGEGNEINT